VKSAVTIKPSGARLLATKEAAVFIGVEHQTLRKWRSRGAMLEAYAELSTGPVWWDLDLVAWARENKRGKWKDRN